MNDGYGFRDIGRDRDSFTDTRDGTADGIITIDIGDRIADHGPNGCTTVGGAITVGMVVEKPRDIGMAGAGKVEFTISGGNNEDAF